MSTHLILLHAAPAGLDRAALLRHWQEVRGPWIARRPGVRRYVQDIVLAASDGSGWFGVEEFWMDGSAPQSGPALPGVPAGEAGAQEDEVPAVPGAGAGIPLWVADHVVVAGAPIGRDDALPKRMTFLRRKPGLERAAMLHYWRHAHGPLAASVPGVRRYVQGTVALAEDGSGAGRAQPAPPIDGVAQIWIEDAAALQAIVASPLFREQVKPDEANFVATDLTFTLSVAERRIVW